MPSFEDEKPSKKSNSSDDIESYVTASFDLNLKEARVLVYGQPKVGKTTTAMTCSDFWPGELPSKKPVMLEDTLSIAADRNANVGLKAAGITLHEFDIRRLLSDGKVKNIREALKKAADAACYYVNVKGVKNVIVDTISMIDFELGKYWSHRDNAPRSEKTQEIDKYAVFREILNSHGSLWQDIDFLRARVIFLCHADVSAESVKPVQNDRDKAKLAVSTLAGTDTDIRPLITGKALDLYLRNTDLVLPIRMFGEAGSKGVERKFLPYGGAGMAGGNRYHFVLKQEEDAHLGNLLKRIQTNADKITTSIA